MAYSLKAIRAGAGLPWISKFYRAGLVFSIFLLVGELGLLFFVPAADRATVNFGVLFFSSLFSFLVLGYTAWQTRRVQPRLFPSWLMLTLAMACNPIAGILGAAILVFAPAANFSLIINFFVLIVYPLFFLTVALLPSQSTRRLELIQWLFDALVVAFSLTLVFWVFYIQPDLLTQHQDFEQKILSLANQVGDLLILWGMVMILFRRLSEQQIKPLLWVFLSFLLLLVYDSLTASADVPYIFNAYDSLKEIILNASIVCLAMAGLQQLLALNQPLKEKAGDIPAGVWETTRLMMPYAGLGSAFAVLILSLITPQALNPLAIAIWVGLILVMVSLRQVLVIRENQRLSGQLFQLNARLEQRVVERTEALIAANQELSEREIRMAYNALHDALTGLANRTLLSDRLEQSIRRMRRDPEYSFGVLFMDLDGFKVVNDSLGHVSGDKLLVQIAQNLVACVREIDTVARLGGDEFVILLDGCMAGECMVETARRVLNMFAAPFAIDNQYAYMAASLGIVPGSPSYADPAEILRDADLAMYEAKALGKACYVIFTPELRTYALDRLMLEKDLRIALEKRELHLNYQPIINLADDSILGFEALLRWQHPLLGMISPGTFIPIAESNGMISPITFWVLEAALQQLSAWKKAHPGIPLTMSVNLSVRLFSQPDLIQMLEKLLNEAHLQPEDLILEITESAIIQDASIAIKILQACQKMGVRIHLDDFGTGYSSLSYLHNFPFDGLKVSQDFVVRIQPAGENSEIVRTIVSLAHDLDLEVIAEGIETSAQLEYIRNLGCQGGQGFFISRPLAPEDAARFIPRHSSAG